MAQMNQSGAALFSQKVESKGQSVVYDHSRSARMDTTAYVLTRGSGQVTTGG